MILLHRNQTHHMGGRYIQGRGFINIPSASKRYIHGRGLSSLHPTIMKIVNSDLGKAISSVIDIGKKIHDLNRSIQEMKMIDKIGRGFKII